MAIGQIEPEMLGQYRLAVDQVAEEAIASLAVERRADAFNRIGNQPRFLIL